jgi:glycine cleavage system H lipoate-binding protein
MLAFQLHNKYQNEINISLLRLNMVALFVVLTFILFILIDFLVLKAQGKKHPAFSTVKVFDRGFAYPGDVYLSPGHTWLSMLKEGMVRIGVDEFIQKTLAGIKFITLLTEGSRVQKGDIIFSAVSNDKIVNFYAPVTGTIRKVNTGMQNRGIDDPYKNWVVSIEAENLNSELKGMKFRESATNWLAEEYARLKDFLSFHSQEMAVAGTTMHDGGNIMEGVVTSLNANSIREFENQFLKV